MHLLTVTSILVATASLCRSQVTAVNANKATHWCGQWAGSPRLEDRPRSQQLPPFDYTRRFFVEPQLLNTPFAPIMASEPKVQVPKIWGNNEFRLALMSFVEPIGGGRRVYSSSKSRWQDFGETLQLLLDTCVSKGTGGAYLVPPSPGLTQSTLVVYAYAVGSYFDFQMNYYMSTPSGIDPARIGQNYLDANGNFTAPAVDVL